MSAWESKKAAGGSSVLPVVLGCVGGGCLLIIVGIVVAGFALGAFVRDVKNLAADTPSVAAYEPTAAQSAALDGKLAQAQAALQSNEPAELVLTADEINTLIAREQAKGGDPNAVRVQLQITDDTVFGKASLPFPQANGPPKYLNGEADLNVRIANGRLEVYIRDFRVTDRKLPTLFKEMIASLKQQNLAEDFNTNPQHAEARAKLRHVERLEIRDGRVHLKLRPGAPLPTPTPAPRRTAGGETI